MSESIFQTGVLYSKPKQSDMLEGIADGIQVLLIEWDKYQKFYGYDYNSNINNYLQSLRNSDYTFRQAVEELRKRGL